MNKPEYCMDCELSYRCPERVRDEKTGCLVPGPECPFVQRDSAVNDLAETKRHWRAREKQLLAENNRLLELSRKQSQQIAKLVAAIDKARMLMLGDPSVNASDKLECASYALDEARPLPESDVRIVTDEGGARAVDYTPVKLFDAATLEYGDPDEEGGES